MRSVSKERRSRLETVDAHGKAMALLGRLVEPGTVTVEELALHREKDASDETNRGDRPPRQGYSWTGCARSLDEETLR